MADGQKQAGYDAAPLTQDRDDLERWRFAAEILRILSDTPPEWSARLGVFGAWGEGKTTVLGFLNTMARAHGHLPFWFNPWAATNQDDLWKEFAARLLEALDEAGIAVEGLKWVRFKLWFNRLSRYEKAVKQLSAIDPEAKRITGAGLPLVRRLVRIDSAHIKKIRSQLNDKRIVVLVDDLDRADPRLVPQFLLSLREVLDQPGFTFVLAFDPVQVGKVLHQYHPAWASGENFLEKILDFTFTLPRVTETQSRRLIQRGIKRYCPFAPEPELEKIYDLLPNNPRRLKSLVRALSVLKTEVQRHDPHELNWVEIGIAHLIKLECPQLLDRLMEGKEIEGELGLAYDFSQEIARQANQNGHKDDPLHQLAEELGSDDEQRARLKKLIDALRARGSHAGRPSFRYQAQLASGPHKITSKELREVLVVWEGSNERSGPQK